MKINKIFDKFKKSKPSITLAEILIVLVIVAVVAGVFMAMPKKNVNMTDRTKYYIAYNALKRMQDEQMANFGHAAINYHDFIHDEEELDEACDNTITDYCKTNPSTHGDLNEDFVTAVNYWLNVLDSVTNDDGDEVITLTNGMQIILEASKANPVFLSSYEVDGDTIETYALTVKVDIDGPDKGDCTDDKDCHYFDLDTNGDVHVNASSDWLTFKVYHIGDDGKMAVDGLQLPYDDAYIMQCCLNGHTPNCEFTDADTGGEVTLDEPTCRDVYGYDWNRGTYFIEANPPIKM